MVRAAGDSGFIAWADAVDADGVADAAALAAHLADTVDAHDATAVSFSPAQGIAATTVQAAIEEVVTDASATYQPLRANTVAIFSDSILGQGLVIEGFTGNPDPSTILINSTRNALTWAQIRGRQRYDLVCEGAVSGDTTTQMLARVSTITSYSPRWVLGQGGINDIMADVATATIQSNLTAIFTALRAARCGIVWHTILPSTQVNSAARRTTIHTVNEWLRDQTRAGVIDALVDAHSLIVDPATGNPASTYTYDGTHPTALGAAIVGRAQDEVLCTLVPPLDTRLSAYNDPANVGTNSFLTGDTAGMATSWFAGANSGGAPTYTPTKVARTDRYAAPGEEWQQLALVSGDLRYYQNIDAAYVAGDVYVAECEYDLDAGSGYTYLSLILTALTSGGGATLSASHANFHFPGPGDGTGDPYPSSSLVTSGVLRTPPMTMLATTARLQPKFRLQGAGTVRIARMSVRKLT